MGRLKAIADRCKVLIWSNLASATCERRSWLPDSEPQIPYHFRYRQNGREAVSGILPLRAFGYTEPTVRLFTAVGTKNLGRVTVAVH